MKKKQTDKYKTAKRKKRKKKERAKRKAKQTTIIVDEREPKEIVDKLREQPDVEVKVVSPARRAFQDV